MANYYGTTRTNYFAVKDADAFREELSKYPVEVITKEAGVNGEVATLYGFMDSDLDGSGDVWNYYNPETHEGEEIHWDEVFARHLADGWVAIIITSGAEKHRYVNGFAKLAVGKARYGVMLNDDGLVLDDDVRRQRREAVADLPHVQVVHVGHAGDARQARHQHGIHHPQPRRWHGLQREYRTVAGRGRGPRCPRLRPATLNAVHHQ